jgi:transcriptional regulator with XRE-family HTH domain
MLNTPKNIAQGIAKRVKQKRIGMNMTQRELAERSGVSFGSVKRFEQKAEISLKHLLHIAVVLRSLSDFEALFTQDEYQSIDEVIEEKKKQERKRAGRNDS